MSLYNFFRKFKYRTVHVKQITINWEDTGRKSMASILFQENGFGERRLRNEGTLWPSTHEEHTYYQEVAIPWREYLCGEEKPPRKIEGNVIPFGKGA